MRSKQVGWSAAQQWPQCVGRPQPSQGDNRPSQLAPSCAQQIMLSTPATIHVITLFSGPASAPRVCTKPGQVAHDSHLQSPLCLCTWCCWSLNSGESRIWGRWGQLCLPQGSLTCRCHPQPHSQESPGIRHCQWPTAVQLHSMSRSGPWWSLRVAM
jgi:hypothetical protein